MADGLERLTAALVAEIMTAELGGRVKAVNWQQVLGGHYKATLRKLARWRGYSKTDPTAWVNLTDTINDLIMDRLFEHEAGAIGKYTVGDVGSVLSPRGRFARKYPRLFDVVHTVHDLRLASDLSHAVLRATGTVTRRIEHKEIPSVKQQLSEGYLELWTAW